MGGRTDKQCELIAQVLLNQYYCVLFYHHVHGPVRIDEAITPMQTVGSGPAQIQSGPDGRTDLLHSLTLNRWSKGLV